jgi:tetratricopeptide (TPR) repeat protein
MNKLILSFVVLLGTISVNETMAQASKVMSANTYLSDYNLDKKTDNLLKAKEAIDAAAKHDVTSLQGKTWLTRGIIYQTLFVNPELGNGPDDFATEALKSLENSLTINDTKFKDQAKSITYLKALSADVFNRGVDVFQKGTDMKSAYKYFYMMTDLNKVLEANKETGVVTTAQSLGNAAQAAEKGGLDKEARDAYFQLITIDPQPFYFAKVAAYHKENGNIEKALSVLDEGAKKYPEDAGITIEQLNIYIAQDKLSEAIGLIDKAIALQPENDMLYFVKGNAYDGAKKPEEAEKAYKQALDINPDNNRALFNLAAIYYLGANVYIEQMSNLGLSAADQKKYDALDLKRKENYKLAKPYFERVLELIPDDKEAKKALDKINSVLGK